jgi:hypothetical protein
MQSDNTSAPVSVTTSAAPLSPEFHSAKLARDSTFRSAKASLPGFGSVGLVIDLTFDFLGDFNWNSDGSTYSTSNFDGAGIGGLF